MSKDISISEGRKGRNFSTRKLKTTNINGGTDLWIPEDDVGDFIDKDNKEIFANGTYYASVDGLSAYNEVNVDVTPRMSTKNIIANGTYTATADGVEAYSRVIVNVKKASPTLISKMITANGTYNATADGADGYSTVTVNVPSGSSYYKYDWTESDDNSSPDVLDAHGIEYNGKIYVLGTKASYSDLYSWSEDDGWTQEESAVINDIPFNLTGYGTTNVSLYRYIVVYDGAIHCVGVATASGGGISSGYAYHLIYNGSWSVETGDGLHGTGIRGFFLYDSKLWGIQTQSNKLRYYDGDSWEEDTSMQLPWAQYLAGFIEYDGGLHFIGGQSHTYKHYVFSTGAWQELPDLPFASSNSDLMIYDNKIYNLTHQSNTTPPYSYNGSFWRPEELRPSVLSTSTYPFAVHNGKIHIIGSSSRSVPHYIIEKVT